MSVKLSQGDPNGATLADLQRDVDDWVRTVGVRYFSELTNTAILSEEVGEVSRLMARLYGEQSFKSGEEVGADELALEMADVLFVLICLANQTGINLAEAFDQAMQKKTNRDRKRHAENPKLNQ